MRPCVPIAVLLLSGAPLAAQESSRLTLDLAVRRALETSPTLAAATSARTAAAGGVREARSQWLPSVSAEGSLVRHAEPMVVAPFHGFTPDRIPEFDRTLIQGSLSAGYTVFDGGGRRGQVAQARAFEGVADAEVEAVTAAVILGAVRAYVEVQSAAGALDAQDHRLRSLEAEVRRVERFLAEGRAAQVEALRVQAALAQARADRITAASRLEVAEAELARLTGLEPGGARAGALTPVRLVPEPPAARDALAAEARALSPVLQGARERVAAAEAALRAARAPWFPTLRVEGRVVTYGAADAPGTTEWQTGMRLAWPLFTGGRRMAGVDRARAELRAAEAALREAERGVASALDRAVASAGEADRRVDALALAVEHLAEVARIEALALDQGAGTQSEYLRAEADLATARAALVQARSAQVAARVEVARVAGGLTPESLTAMLRTEP